jgi:hypothetical protein
VLVVSPAACRGRSFVARLSVRQTVRPKKTGKLNPTGEQFAGASKLNSSFTTEIKEQYS